MFPPPSKIERDRYIQFWSRKLATQSELGFSDEVSEKIALESDGLSFAYLKEVLYVQEKLTGLPTVSPLC